MTTTAKFLKQIKMMKVEELRIVQEELVQQCTALKMEISHIVFDCRMRGFHSVDHSSPEVSEKMTALKRFEIRLWSAMQEESKIQQQMLQQCQELRIIQEEAKPRSNVWLW